MWRMRVVHATGYAYKSPVTASFNEARLTPRSDSRQNVILELGYFIAALGRGRVRALHEPGVELPSDVHGWVYTSLESDWQGELVRELKDAGLDVDANLLYE